MISTDSIPLDTQLRAYAAGYYAGRFAGVISDTAYTEQSLLRHLYRRGYDAGVADHIDEEKDE